MIGRAYKGVWRLVHDAPARVAGALARLGVAHLGDLQGVVTRGRVRVWHEDV